MTYSRADKARAVEVYLAEGATAAALAVGCSRQTVYRFLAECDTVAGKKGEATRAATLERQQLKRMAMQELFADKALELAAAVDPDDPNTARFATPAAIFADKHLMLAGLLKKDRGLYRPTVAELNMMISEMEEELRKVAPETSRVDVDQALSRMTAEIERKVRGELLAEVDRELAQATHPERAAVIQQVLATAPAPNGKLEEEPPAHPPAKPRYRREPPDVGPTWH